MLRVLGGALVLLASGSFGITAGVRYYRAARHLQAFCRAIELLRCEINYSLQPLPEVCALVADRLAGPPAAFFRCFAAQLREPVSRDRAAAQPWRPRGACSFRRMRSWQCWSCAAPSGAMISTGRIVCWT